ncbi:undecaprenyldiphospho-muramoylpentapeptide beta-N-acetylglucosaminyltransferase [Thermovibrio sp.]
MVAGGGTGGHYFPALSVAGELKKRGHEVYFVGSTGGIEGKLGFPAKKSLYLKHGQVRGKGLEVLKSLPLHGLSFLESISFLREVKPDGVVVFGGYSCLPVGLGASALRIPLFIQEQNSVPGRSNRLLSRFASLAFLGFPTARSYLKCSSLFTGNPLREEILTFSKKKEKLRKELLKRLGLSGSRPTLLILGGSQGALNLNRFVEKAVPVISSLNLQVVHITGFKKEGRLRELYGKYGIRALLFPFYEKIWELYAVSDLAVSRAGALAISELSAFKIPALLVPYPYAADDHQYLNGKFVEEGGGGFVLREEELSLDNFKKRLESMVFDIMGDRKMAESTYKLFPKSSSSLIVSEIERWTGKRS